MDLIVRQAAEAGVSLILPFIGEHSVSRPEAGRDSENRRERWDRIVREARQQSGSETSTEIREPLALPGALAAWREFASTRGDSVGVFLHQDPLAQGSLHGYLSHGPRAVAVAVGPEGGFSPAEAAAMTAARFKPALLGENVLRAETAAIFALAAVQVILLETESWIPRTPYFPESNG
jgi:16S rRNA (uracil1498-N3)-methyltransferase